MALKENKFLVYNCNRDLMIIENKKIEKEKKQ